MMVMHDDDENRQLESPQVVRTYSIFLPSLRWSMVFTGIPIYPGLRVTTVTCSPTTRRIQLTFQNTQPDKKEQHNNNINNNTSDTATTILLLLETYDENG